jgi:cysteine desulfurase
MLANNEVGSVSPITEISGFCRQRNVPLHTDAVQAFGKIPVNVNDLRVDMMTISAHKIYGPKGVGALFLRRGLTFSPLLYGGGQERGRRPGTENVAAIVGFARAAEIAVTEMETESERLRSLRDDLEAAVKAEFPEVLVNGDRRNRLPNILNISFDSQNIGLEGEMLLVNLDLAGLSLTGGSACTSGSLQPSHVILAMGRDRGTANATLRFAFGRSSRPEDTDRIITALRDAVEKSRRKR